MTSNKRSWVIKLFSLTILVCFYLLTRLTNLSALPIFADEAIYIRWSQIIKNVETLRFIPLTDGKQPLFMWATVPFLSIVKDPLQSARLLSVTSGLINLVFIFLTVSILFYKPKTIPSNPLALIVKSIDFSYYPAFVASLIYILLPFSFFFDRLATPDILLTSFTLISTYLTIVQSFYFRLDISILLGVSLGLAYLTKSPALYFIVLSSSCLSAFALIRNHQPLLLKLFYSLFPVIISLCFYSILKLGPQSHMIALRNKDYIWPISEIVKHPLNPLRSHLLATLAVYRSYTSLPILLIFLAGFMYSLPKYKKLLNFKILYVFAVFMVPIIATTSMAKVFTGRYILFSLPYFVILLTYFLFCLPRRFFKNRLLPISLFILFFLPNIIMINRLSTDPAKVVLASTETGYLNDWTAGWGIKDISLYLKERAKKANVIVGTEGYFGSLPDGLQIYTDGTLNITVIGLGINLQKIPDNLLEAKDFGDEVYLLINTHRHLLPPSEIDKLTIIKSYTRPDNTMLVLYKLI